MLIISLSGLIDEGETAEQAAIRELEEETGYKAQKVIESSSLLVADPGKFPHYASKSVSPEEDLQKE